MLVVAQGGVLSLVPGCSATVSAGNGQVSGTLAARSFPSAGSPVGATVDLYTASAPADSIGYVPAAAGTQLAYPAGIAVSIPDVIPYNVMYSTSLNRSVPPGPDSWPALANRGPVSLPLLFSLSLPLLFLSIPSLIHRPRRRSSASFRGHDILARKYVSKINKMPEFYMIPARKIIKIPEFLSYLPEKLTKFANFT